ncbi:MAG TPA: methylmalonyl Co-A mutase-associated GTPase MeaB [Myxococcales bacterium]
MLADAILRRDVRAASRLMRLIDDRDPSAIDELRALFPHTGRAWILGITGSPGAGKSTLVDQLVTALRAEGRTVGVVAVDPTSPFSGGAILGDRVRMQGHATDPGVFIRSLATRGSLGGLSRATSDVVRVLDAMGQDVVIVETVGVGQDELDVARLAHTVLVVVVPGMGDDVQALKAGILEIADVFAVNKADKEGADRTVRELRGMLELRPVPGSSLDFWTPPILPTTATTGQGMAELVQALTRHRSWLVETGGLEAREAARAKSEFLAHLRERLVEAGLAALGGVGTLDEIAIRIARRQQDPYALGETLANELKRPRT